MHIIEKKIRSDAYTYAQYRSLTASLLAVGKTTGHLQTPSLVGYTELNDKRMIRLDKTFRPDAMALDLLQKIRQPMLWLTITEAWCGDAGQITPVLNGLAKLNPHIELRLILRDEHPEIMDAFLTDGSRSIPKVIFTHPTDGQVLGVWGPRPATAQAIMLETKAELQVLEHDKVARKARYEEGQKALHTWYARDKTVHIQREAVQAALDSLAHPSTIDTSTGLL
ncbi:MAG: thioredoxin family protein [Bacteroidetes bacterium]|nr:MAG: thioredoxin family protein [Bacteroidota bacterium]